MSKSLDVFVMAKKLYFSNNGASLVLIWRGEFSSAELHLVWSFLPKTALYRGNSKSIKCYLCEHLRWDCKDFYWAIRCSWSHVLKGKHKSLQTSLHVLSTYQIWLVLRVADSEKKILRPYEASIYYSLNNIGLSSHCIGS